MFVVYCKQLINKQTNKNVFDKYDYSLKDVRVTGVK